MAGKSIFILFLSLFLLGEQQQYFAQQATAELKDLSRDADLIITGKVIQQTSSWNEDRTRIYTSATIQVGDYIKGANNGGSVVVTHLGGEVGDVGETYSHVPTFENNEEVLVFLKKDNTNSEYKVLYGEDGKIGLTNDTRTGEKVTNSKVPVSSLKAQIKNYIAE